MPDDFKDYFNETLIRTMGRAFVDIAPEFPEQRFCQIALDDLVTLELKDRSNQIARAMVETLPDDFAEASAILINSLPMKALKMVQRACMVGASCPWLPMWNNVAWATCRWR